MNTRLPARLMSFFVLLICLALRGLAQDATQNPQLWREDLAYLAQEMPRRHFDAFHSMSREEWNRQVANLHEAIPALPDHAIIVRLKQLLALIGDQHTWLNLPSTRYPFHSYPILLTNRPDGIFVTRILANRIKTNRGVVDNRHLAGLRVVQIGGLDIEQVKERVATMISRDNQYSFTVPLIDLLIVPEILHELGILPDMARGVYTLADPEGQWHTATLPPYPAAEINQLEYVSWLGLRRWIPPLYYSHPSTQLYWYEYLPERRAVYFRYANCREMETLPFSIFSRDLLNFLNTNNVNKLIVDLRGNPGGTPSILEPFIEAIRKHPYFNQRGRLFVLINNGTASSAVWAANSFQLWTNAILLGEPTGGRPNWYGDASKFTLPHSELVVFYSQRFFQIRFDDDPVAIFPDVLVPYPWSAIQEGRDPVLEVALNYFE